MNTPTSPLPRKIAKPRTKSPRKPKVTPATPPVVEEAQSKEAATPVIEQPHVEDAPLTQQEVPQPMAEPTPPPAEPQAKPAPQQEESPRQEAQPREFQPRHNRHDRHPRRDEQRQQHPHNPQRQQDHRQEHPRQEQRTQEMGPQTRGLTLLGAKTTVYSDQYTPAILEVFENRHPENDYFVKFNCPEFTSLCPITGQPDFATLYISYIPDRRMVESKSLKLYLFSFRNHGAFHEDCVNIIMKDLIKLMAPRYIEVWGKFLPRGGLSIDPFANYGRPTTRWEEFARQRLLMHDLNPEPVNNR